MAKQEKAAAAGGKAASVAGQEGGARPLIISRASLATRADAARTADPDRFFIRTSRKDGYGHDPEVARKAESLIAAAREGVVSGALTTLREIEDFIARPYIAAFHPQGEVLKRRDLGRETIAGGAKLRSVATGMMPKHFPYMDRVNNLLARNAHHTRTLQVGNIQLHLVTTLEIAEVRGTGIPIDAMDGYNGPGWLPTEDVESARLLDVRREELLAELLIAGQESPAGATLERILKIMAEIEWLSAQRWRYDRGTAGIQQVAARALLEAVGVETGRYCVDVDPNLEALTSDLDDYVAKYSALYESNPRFF
ncbi:MAG TPA: hypothetical protein V6D17_02990 [Candidatus Obscuribacterales bacterium]